MPAFKTRVFVSNLPEDFSSQELEELFSPCGQMTECHVQWTFGFVDFVAEDAADKAILQINHKETSEKKKLNVMKASAANALTSLGTSSTGQTTVFNTPICSRLFVGNLEEDITQEELMKTFERHGSVNLVEVKKTFAFVRFDTPEEAAAAKKALDRTKCRIKLMRINFAEPRRQAKLFVGGLSDRQTPEELKEVFSKYGYVLDVSVMNKYGFVNFDDDQDALKAKEALHLSELNGSKIKVEVSTSEGGNVIGSEREKDRCNKCGEFGHWAKECMGSGRNQRGHTVSFIPRGSKAAPQSPYGYNPYGYSPYGGLDPYGMSPYGYGGYGSTMGYDYEGGRGAKRTKQEKQ